MIITEELTIGGRDFIKTYSDAGYMIERDGARYSEAIDPAEFHRIYIETDELIEKENLGILYPSDLPDDLKIKEIQQFYESTDEYSLVFVFLERTDRIYVSNNEKIDVEKIENAETVSIGGIDFYVTQTESGIYQATGWHNGFRYNFQSMEYEKIMIMLNCLKGY